MKFGKIRVELSKEDKRTALVKGVKKASRERAQEGPSLVERVHKSRREVTERNFPKRVHNLSQLNLDEDELAELDEILTGREGGGKKEEMGAESEGGGGKEEDSEGQKKKK